MEMACDEELFPTVMKHSCAFLAGVLTGALECTYRRVVAV